MTGRVIAGRYNLVEPIGRGAMGVVWRARDRLLDRDVAIKEVVLDAALAPDERENAYQRTLREARTAARLSHRGLVTVFDVVEEDGRPWIVMELVISRSLEAMITSDGPLPPRRACRIGQQLLAALAVAHAAGVLHRDVKPSNVLIAQEPGTRDGERAVLTDFGIAQFQGDPRLTQTGMVMGSPGFTAPERIRGGSATPASDLWSLGATIYAAVEGHGPYEDRGGPITTMTAIINEDAPYARKGGTLAQVVDALLRRNPAARPSASVAARMFAQALPLLPDSPAKPRLVPPRRAERVPPTRPLGATSADGAHPGIVPSRAEAAPAAATAPEPGSPAADPGAAAGGAPGTDVPDKDVPDSEAQDAQVHADQASTDEALVAAAHDEASDETPDARAPEEDGASEPTAETGDAADAASENAVSGHGVSDGDANDDDTENSAVGGDGDDIADAGTTIGGTADEPIDDDPPETQQDVPGSGSKADSGSETGSAEASDSGDSDSETGDSGAGHAEPGGTASAGADDDPEAGEQLSETSAAKESAADDGAGEDSAAEDSAAEDSLAEDDIAEDASASHAVTGHSAPADDTSIDDASPGDTESADAELAVPPPADPVILIDRVTTEPAGKPGPPAAAGSGYRPGNYQAATSYRPDTGYQTGSPQSQSRGQGQNQGPADGPFAPGLPATGSYDPRQDGAKGFPSAPPASTRNGVGARGGRSSGRNRWGRWAILAAVVVVLAAAIGVAAAFLIQRGSGANASSDTGRQSAQALQSPPTAVQMIDGQAAAPAGWQTITVSAAKTGTTAGFSIAAPPSWTVRQSTLATTITAPDGIRYVEVDLTPHHYANMLSEANYIQKTALSEGHFPGYHLVSLKQVTIRGTSGAFWAFTWLRPDGTVMRVNDLLFVLPTPAGPQSYAIYVTAPDAQFAGSKGLGTFAKLLASFQAPAQS
jgi:hypothetical protein